MLRKFILTICRFPQWLSFEQATQHLVLASKVSSDLASGCLSILIQYSWLTSLLSSPVSLRFLHLAMLLQVSGVLGPFVSLPGMLVSKTFGCSVVLSCQVSTLRSHISERSSLISLYWSIPFSWLLPYSIYGILLFRVLINTRGKNGSLYRVQSSVYSMKYKLFGNCFSWSPGIPAPRQVPALYYISENTDCITGTSLQVSGIRDRPRGRLAIFRYILKV